MRPKYVRPRLKNVKARLGNMRLKSARLEKVDSKE